MNGEVIEIDYQLYVRFENGAVAILDDFYWLNMVGIWRQFDYTSYVENGTFIDKLRVSGSSTDPFPTEELLKEYVRLIDDVYAPRSVRKEYNKKYSVDSDYIMEWKKNNGYDKFGTCNPLMKSRIEKVKKLKLLIK